MTHSKTATLQGVDCHEYVGPYESWHFNDGKPFTFPAIHQANSPYFTALAELPHSTSLQKDLNKNGAMNDDSLLTRLPPLWHTEGFTAQFIPFIYQDPHQVGGAYSSPNGFTTTPPTKPAYFRTNFPVNPLAWVEDYQTDGVPNQWVANSQIKKTKKRIIVIGVIDDGIPFANDTLLDENGKTRMEFCWLQSAKAASSSHHVPFGREYTNCEIDQLKQKFGADEDVLYEKAGATSSEMPELGLNIRRHSTHGAHILSTAAGHIGSPDADPLADEIRIIAVQMPNTIAWDTSGFSKDMYMLSAVHYILNRAKHLAKHYAQDCEEELPLVVNFSYGWSGGRHDGEGYLESAIGALIDARRELAPSAMVIPSGNTFANDMHGIIKPADFNQNSYDFGWKIQPTDRTSSYLELWFPEGYDPKDFELTVTSPNGKSVTQMNLIADPNLTGFDSRKYQKIEFNGQNIGQLSLDHHRGTRWRVMIALAPSEAGKTATPSGLWNVQLDYKGRGSACSDVIHCWVQRDDDPASLKTGGRQSYLVDATKIEPNPDPLAEIGVGDGFVQAFGSLSGIANHNSTTVVGGYNDFNHKPAPYSSAGILLKQADGSLEPRYKQVDCAAISDRTPSLPGVMATGVKSGSRSWLIGTSTAAPAVARELAKAFFSLSDAEINSAAADNYVSILPQKFRQNHCSSTACKIRLGGNP